MRRLALVVLGAALLTAGCGGAERTAAGACSAASLDPSLPAQALPPAVAETRQAIVDAAVGCDDAALDRLARDGSREFTFSFGGGDDPVAYWNRLEGSGERPLAILATILRLDPVAPEGGVYAWPAVHGPSPTAEDWQAVVRAGVLSQPEADAMRAQGAGYLGWRAGIADDGEWLFFVAGD